MAEKLVGAEWHIQEKQPKLAHNEVRSIAKELIYDNYEQEIGRVIKDNPVVSQLAKCNPVAARYLATGLVDFRNSYGKDLLTEARTKIMEEVSIVQADLHQKIDNTMQDYDDKILSGKHKSLSSNILDTSLLASDREMTAKSVTSRAGEDLTHSLLLRGGSYYEQLHDHHEYHNHGMKTGNDSHHFLEHEYRHEIATKVKQTRAMQHEYHQEIEQQYDRQVNINNDININY